MSGPSYQTHRLPDRLLQSLLSLALLLPVANAQTILATGENGALDREIHDNMSFLASDDLHGRGSGTENEHLAAQFCANQMRILGLEPGAPNGSFLLEATLPLPNSVLRKAAQDAALGAALDPNPGNHTWDAIAVLRGSDPELREEAILLTAHLDHLGEMSHAVPRADRIFNGADDDASGTTAVLALMHRLAAGPRPARTVIFALFGSEEIGGFGNQAFLAHPPVPLSSIVANLEFEMIGRPDPSVPAGTLWLTGFERSDLGPELARHGAHLVADPHPDEHFFQRSDNFALAKQGIVAQTISSFGLHPDYHRTTDDLAHIDFAHMAEAIRSMEAPIAWLSNTSWKPAWTPHGRP